VNGEAIFEEADPKRFLDLLVTYGLEDSPNAQPLRQAAPSTDEPLRGAPEPTKVTLTVEVAHATRQALQRRAAASGMPVGAFLDLVFGDE
jgi:hypothetical protein